MYADASTYSGPDEDPLFDYDDELTVMAKDLGQSRAPEMPSNFPENVIKDSFVEVGIADPLQEGNIYGFFYLFESARKEDGGGYFWRPDAGQKRVQYEFRLTTIDENGSNAYKDVYDMHSGRNPEDTWFSSDFYQRHFSENWYVGGAYVNVRMTGTYINIPSLSYQGNRSVENNGKWKHW